MHSGQDRVWQRNHLPDRLGGLGSSGRGGQRSSIEVGADQKQETSRSREVGA